MIYRRFLRAVSGLARNQPMLLTNFPIGSPEFKKLLTTGLVCVGAEVEYAMSAIKKGAQPGPDDEVV
jgi:hypothetical protein